MEVKTTVSKSALDDEQKKEWKEKQTLLKLHLERFVIVTET